MRVPRIHIDSPLRADAELTLPAAATTHLVRVLRLREHSVLTVFDGQGHEHHAEIMRIHDHDVTIRIGAAIEVQRETPLRVTLVQGISRGERMDWTLQKATELGIHRIVPVLTARSVVRLEDKQAERKREHWQQIVIGACEQSGRSVVPEVEMPLSLRAYLHRPAASSLRLTLDPEGTEPLAGLNGIDDSVELLVGPEGGLDPEELHTAQRAGFKSVRLGPRILRTETASVVALSVLQALWGDFK